MLNVRGNGPVGLVSIFFRNSNCVAVELASDVSCKDDNSVVLRLVDGSRYVFWMAAKFEILEEKLERFMHESLNENSPIYTLDAHSWLTPAQEFKKVEEEPQEADLNPYGTNIRVDHLQAVRTSVAPQVKRFKSRKRTFKPYSGLKVTGK
jgi:hypothetical protein